MCLHCILYEPLTVGSAERIAWGPDDQTIWRRCMVTLATAWMQSARLAIKLLLQGFMLVLDLVIGSLVGPIVVVGLAGGPTLKWNAHSLYKLHNNSRHLSEKRPV